MHEADRKELNVLVGVPEKVFHPFHGLRMEEQVRPLHIFIPAQAPELKRIGRLLIDVVENKLPVFLSGLGRFKRLTIGMVQLVTEFTLDGAAPAKADGNFTGIQFLTQDLPIVLALENRHRLKHRKGSSHRAPSVSGAPEIDRR